MEKYRKVQKSMKKYGKVQKRLGRYVGLPLTGVLPHDSLDELNQRIDNRLNNNN